MTKIKWGFTETEQVRRIQNGQLP